MRNKVILALLITLSLSLLACSLVQTWAEPLDRAGCEADCKLCEFSRYTYETHDCYCICNGIEIQLY